MTNNSISYLAYLTYLLYNSYTETSLMSNEYRLGSQKAHTLFKQIVKEMTPEGKDEHEATYKLLSQINPIVEYNPNIEYKGLKSCSVRVANPYTDIVLRSNFDLGKHFYDLNKSVEKVRKVLDQIISIEIEEKDMIGITYVIYGVPKEGMFDKIGNMTELGEKTLNNPITQ